LQQKTRFVFHSDSEYTEEYMPVTVQFPNWGKKKAKGFAGYETSTCFMARHVSEKYQSQIHRPLEYHQPAQSLENK
jgi:hypothetical protein